MTTIAYKEGIIAYDSRVTDNGRITDDDFDKRLVVNGVSFFITGCFSDAEKLIDVYFNLKSHEHIDCRAIVLDNSELLECGVSEKSGLWKYKMRPDNPAAIGSGADFAMAAMTLGYSAKQAVELAAKLDSCTGGCIRYWRL